jgi:hypothetical protein
METDTDARPGIIVLGALKAAIVVPDVGQSFSAELGVTDVDKDGAVSQDEFKEAILALGVGISAEEATAVFAVLDVFDEKKLKIVNLLEALRAEDPDAGVGAAAPTPAPALAGAVPDAPVHQGPSPARTHAEEAATPAVNVAVSSPASAPAAVYAANNWQEQQSLVATPPADEVAAQAAPPVPATGGAACAATSAGEEVSEPGSPRNSGDTKSERESPPEPAPAEDTDKVKEQVKEKEETETPAAESDLVKSVRPALDTDKVKVVIEQVKEKEETETPASDSDLVKSVRPAQDTDKVKAVIEQVKEKEETETPASESDLVKSVRNAVRLRDTSICATFKLHAESDLEFGSLSASQFFTAMRELETGLSIAQMTALFTSLCDSNSARLSFSALFQGLAVDCGLQKEDIGLMLRSSATLQLLAAQHVLNAIGGSTGHNAANQRVFGANETLGKHIMTGLVHMLQRPVGDNSRHSECCLLAANTLAQLVYDNAENALYFLGIADAVHRIEFLLTSTLLVKGESVARSVARIICNISSTTLPLHAKKTAKQGGPAQSAADPPQPQAKNLAQKEGRGRPGRKPQDPQVYVAAASEAAALLSQSHASLLARALKVLFSPPPREHAVAASLAAHQPSAAAGDPAPFWGKSVTHARGAATLVAAPQRSRNDLPGMRGRRMPSAIRVYRGATRVVT